MRCCSTKSRTSQIKSANNTSTTTAAASVALLRWRSADVWVFCRSGSSGMLFILTTLVNFESKRTRRSRIRRVQYAFPGVLGGLPEATYLQSHRA